MGLFPEPTPLTAVVDRRTVVSCATLMPRPTTELVAPNTGIVGTLTLTVELDVKVDVLALQVDLVVTCLGRTHRTVNVEVPMVASSATLTAPFTKEHAVHRMDGVVTPLLTVGLAAKADVMAQLAVLGATLGRQLHLWRRREHKSLCWARLPVRLQLVVILQMALVALEMGTPFVATGQTVLVVLFMG